MPPPLLSLCCHCFSLCRPLPLRDQNPPLKAFLSFMAASPSSLHLLPQSQTSKSMVKIVAIKFNKCKFSRLSRPCVVRVRIYQAFWQTMGNSLGGKKTPKVMKINGETIKLKTPVAVEEMVKNYPGHVLLVIIYQVFLYLSKAFASTSKLGALEALLLGRFARSS